MEKKQVLLGVLQRYQTPTSTYITRRFRTTLIIKTRVLGQYREMGVLLWRNFGIDSVMDQCFGNEHDKSTKGRQMPVVGCVLSL
jgi:hypothetical protein